MFATDSGGIMTPNRTRIENGGRVISLVNLSLLMMFFFVLIIAGCSTENSTAPSTSDLALKKKPVSGGGTGEFTIEAKYTYCRSYPTGGGIYILRVVPGAGFDGDVLLSLDATSKLGATLDRTTVTATETVFEVALHPSRQMATGLTTFDVVATNSDMTQTVTLEADIWNWGGAGSSTAIEKREDFVIWLEQNHPELGTFSNRSWDSYLTYPGIMIVEHWTHLDVEWEFRVCHHVMIPPDDWSKMCLRRRGEWDPILAAHRESDGTIYEIPIEDYPTFYGY
jgi:hypothetical protein